MGKAGSDMAGGPRSGARTIRYFYLLFRGFEPRAGASMAWKLCR